MPVNNNWQQLKNNGFCESYSYQNLTFQTYFSKASNVRKEYERMSDNVHESSAIVNNLAQI